MGPRLLRLSGVEYLISGIGDPSLPTPDGLDAMMDPVPGTRLFRVNGVLPRVYLAGATRILPDQAAREAVFDSEVVAGRRAILAPHPEAPMLASDAGLVDERVGSCELESFGECTHRRSLPSHPTERGGIPGTVRRWLERLARRSASSGPAGEPGHARESSCSPARMRLSSPTSRRAGESASRSPRFRCCFWRYFLPFGFVVVDYLGHGPAWNCAHGAPRTDRGISSRHLSSESRTMRFE